MTRWWAPALVLIGFGIILAPIHLEIARRDAVIEDGRTIYLPLADASSPFASESTVLTGEFIRKYIASRGVAELRYKYSIAPMPSEVVAGPYSGTVIVSLDERNIVLSMRYNSVADVAVTPQEQLMQYQGFNSPRNHRASDGNRKLPRFSDETMQVKPENASLYANARFTVLRVASDGSAILIGLAGEDLNLIGSEIREKIKGPEGP